MNGHTTLQVHASVTTLSTLLKPRSIDFFDLNGGVVWSAGDDPPPCYRGEDEPEPVSALQGALRG